MVLVSILWIVGKNHEISKKNEMHRISRWENPVDDDTLTVNIYRVLSSWPMVNCSFLLGDFGYTTYLVTDLRG